MANKKISKIILLGPQGSGKSTQGKVISEFLDIDVLPAGDLLRANIRQHTDLGARIADFVNNGELIPNSLMVSLMLEELKKPQYKKGWLLDGFPRDIQQAGELDQHYLVDKVFNIEITNEHLEIIRFVRNFYLEFNTSPAIRMLVKAITQKYGEERGNSRYLYRLFPKGPAKQATKLAGLPKPVKCI